MSSGLRPARWAAAVMRSWIDAMFEAMDMREVNYVNSLGCANERAGVPAPHLNLTLHHGCGWGRLVWIAACCNRQEDHQGRQAGEDDHSSDQVRRSAEDLRWVIWSAPLRDELQSCPNQAQQGFPGDESGSDQHSGIFQAGFLSAVESAAIGGPIAD